MTKEEYMQRLRNALQAYDKEFVDEILDNYEEHFGAGIRSGRTEQEICEELGAVENLVKDIEEMLGDMDIRTHRPDLFTAVQPHQAQYDEIRRIELALVSMDVEISPSSDGKFHAELKSGEELSKYLNETVSDGRYYASEITHNYKNDANGRGLLRMILGNMNNQSQTLILKVPSVLDSVKTKTISGDVELNALSCKALNLETVSGDIELQNCKSETSLLKTTSGDINLEDVTGEEAVLQSASGDMNLHGVEIAKECSFSGASSDMDLSEVKTERARMHSASGDMHLRKVEMTQECNISSSSGDIDAELFSNNISARTTSGDINVCIDTRGKKRYISGKTLSGSMRMESDLYEMPFADETENVIIANVNSVSGTVRIK